MFKPTRTTRKCSYEVLQLMRCTSMYCRIYWINYCVSIMSDTSHVMRGVKGGLIARLKRKNGNCFMPMSILISKKISIVSIL